MFEYLKTLVLRLKIAIFRLYAIFKIYRKFKHLCTAKQSSTHLYLLNIPSHGNLGDHLLSLAEIQFFKDYFPNLYLIPVTSSDLFYSLKLSLRYVRKQDILCITGGGFLGSLYEEEHRFFKILKLFPNNKIIVLPQSIYYEDNHQGHKAFLNAIGCYERHNKLYVATREKKSYDILQHHLMKGRESHIALVPDMALYLHYSFKFDRKGILWCMRNDLEVNRNNDEIIKSLKKQTSQINCNETSTDTYVPYSIPFENEEREIFKKIEQFSQASLVITDRLHGMIFSAITETPVIAMDNISGKVKQVYDNWLSHLPYINFVSNQDDVDGLIDRALSVTNCRYDNDSLKLHYKLIVDFINAKD